MKTAISVPDDVFRQIDRTARRLRISRSELFTRAARRFSLAGRDAEIKASYDAAFADDVADPQTESKLATLTVTPLTTNLRRGTAAGTVLLGPGDTGLSAPAVVLVCQVLAVNNADLVELAGSVSHRSMRAVDAGLRLALDLG
jgi:mRNA interferase MazF